MKVTEALAPDPDASLIIHAIRRQLEDTVENEIRKATEEAVPRIREALLAHVGRISVSLFKKVSVTLDEDVVHVHVNATGLKNIK